MPNALTVLALVPAMGPNPVDEGALRPGLDPSQVTPGMAGFLISLVLAVAVILLVLDFNRRSRRMRYRAEYAERRAAEERAGAAEGAQGPGTDAPSGDAGPSGPAQEPAPPADGGPARRG